MSFCMLPNTALTRKMLAAELTFIFALRQVLSLMSHHFFIGVKALYTHTARSIGHDDWGPAGEIQHVQQQKKSYSEQPKKRKNEKEKKNVLTFIAIKLFHQHCCWGF